MSRWLMADAAWLIAQKPNSLIPGCLMLDGSWLMAQGSWLMAHGAPRALGPGRPHCFILTLDFHGSGWTTSMHQASSIKHQAITNPAVRKDETAMAFSVTSRNYINQLMNSVSWLINGITRLSDAINRLSSDLCTSHFFTMQRVNNASLPTPRRSTVFLSLYVYHNFVFVLYSMFTLW